MIYPNTLQRIIDFYKKIPGIGEKSAERIALASLEIDEKDINDFSDAISNSKKILKKCEICGNLTETKICNICSDELRDNNLICVIEDYKSVFSFEKNGNFKGKYHVLGGLISPLDNITPDEINIKNLIKRCNNNKQIELIIALKSSMEGETTTLYIKKILENSGVKVSRLAYGIPMGMEIDYIDGTTLEKAIEDRKEV